MSFIYTALNIKQTILKRSQCIKNMSSASTKIKKDNMNGSNISKR